MEISFHLFDKKAPEGTCRVGLRLVLGSEGAAWRRRGRLWVPQLCSPEPRPRDLVSQLPRQRLQHHCAFTSRPTVAAGHVSALTDQWLMETNIFSCLYVTSVYRPWRNDFAYPFSN